MDKELKAKWIAALRSGEYAPTKHALRSYTGYCCLGVLCSVHDQSKWKRRSGEWVWDGRHRFIPAIFAQQLGSHAETLTAMNDAGKSFSEIAAYIEANL